MTNWEGDFMKTIVHMMSQLSKNHRVLFVNYPHTYKDLVTTAMGKSKAPWKKMVGLEDNLTKANVPGDAYHLTLPPILPTNWIGNEDSFKKMVSKQAKTVKKSILKTMDRLGMENPIIINAFNPIIGLPLIGAFGESRLIYYCYDEIRAAPWCGKHGGMMEDEFIPKADYVIVTSQGLLETKISKNENTVLVKNGVDFNLFNKAYNPERFEKTQKVIGYVGSVDFRLDYDLLESLITALPDHLFHFVGRISDQSGKDRLDVYDNVTFFGGQQPDDIPPLMRHFDLGLIPFVKNEFTKNVYPLKVNEYLAAGIPVVSTDFASLDDFKEHISIGQDHPDFIQKVKEELSLDSLQQVEARLAVAKSNDWSARAELVEQIITESPHASAY